MWEATDRPLPVYIPSQDAPLVAPWETATLCDLVGSA